MMTDVQELKERGLQVSCINLSCGYYEPHTDHEFTIKKDLMSCLSLVEHIIENCTDTYPHQTEILDGRWRSYDEFDEAVDEIFALLDQGELWSIEDLYYMYHSVFPKLDMEDYQRIYTEYYNLNKIEYGKQNYDLKLAGYIWSILKTQPVIVMSWGVDMDTIKPVKGGLEFHVQGFKHTGMVQIILDEGKDLFEIHLIPDSEGERKIIEDVYFDMLVSIIDENVEKTDDYEKGFLIHTIL